MMRATDSETDISTPGKPVPRDSAPVDSGQLDSAPVNNGSGSPSPGDNTTRRGINRAILSLALPAILNNVTVPLLGLCDTAIAGHLGSPAFIGAMAVGAMMLNVVYWLCGFLRAATGGLTAQAYGASDPAAIRETLSKALVIAAVISLGVLLLRNPMLTLFLRVMGPEPSVAAPASLYFSIVIWAAPAHLGIMAFSGWFIGRQNTVVPMIVAVGVNVVNILLSLTLVFGFGQGFAGIATGTLVATWIGLLAMLLFVRSAYRADRRRYGEPSRDRASRVTFRSYLSVGSDLFFRSACIMGVSFAMTSVGARLGENVLACNAVMMQFFLFFSYFMDGFAFAGEALVGRAVGAADQRLLRSSVGGLFRWGAAMALAFFLIYAFLGNPIVSLLTDSREVAAEVATMWIWLTLLPPITVAAFLFDGVFIGMTRTRPLLVTTIMAASVFFALSFLGAGAGKLPPNPLLWSAFEAYLLLRGVLLALLYPKYQRKLLIL